MNIILFENPEKDISSQNESKINIISYDYDETKPIMFMYKYYYNNSYNYEPIIYSINNKKIIVKQFHKDMLNGFSSKHDTQYMIDKKKLLDIVQRNYPRGRDKLSEKICKSKDSKLYDDLACMNVWLPYDEYLKKYKQQPPMDTLVKDESGETTIYGEINNIIKNKKKINCMVDISDIINYDETQKKMILCKSLQFESQKEELNDEIREILTMENDWKWISKNMSSKYYDKDIESLLRKKFNPKADELLFKCSSDPDEYISANKSNKSWCLNVLKAEYYILGIVMNNIHEQVQKEKSDELNNVIQKMKEITFDKLCFNKYSEVSYIISYD